MDGEKQYREEIRSAVLGRKRVPLRNMIPLLEGEERKREEERAVRALYAVFSGHSGEAGK